MEIMAIYQILSNMFYMFGLSIPQSLWYGLFGGVAVWLVLFILQGIGLWTMAKTANAPTKWLAFVPFANVFLMKKIAGKGNVFGKKVKNLEVYVCIAQIIATAICFLTIAAEMYLYLQIGEPTRTDFEKPYWPGLTGTAYTVSRFYDISGFLISIFGLIFEILMFLLVIGIFRQYAPANYTMLGVLTLFIPETRHIAFFVLRKRKKVDFEAYMRAKREAFIRQQQQYQNMYGNVYQNPYQNPYNQQPNNQPPKKPEDPFEEFASSEQSGKEENTNATNNDDEFFR